MRCVDDYRLKLGNKQLIPIVTGGMGVDISTAELALVAAKLGGIGHISDAMSPTVTDRRYKTKFVSGKMRKNKHNATNHDKSGIHFDLDELEEANRLHVQNTMDAKQGEGLIFVNCMEKLSMNGPKETLRVRMKAAMDAGIDGITLAAGLHLGSMQLMADHPRFRDVKIGIIVSSDRALKLFLRKSASLKRLPDFVVVEGPLAGGHLGFSAEDWHKYDLATITQDVIRFLKENDLDIPVIPAGGIFTGTDAVDFLETGSSAVQLATRFTVTKECGLPDKIKQEYFKVNEDGIEVNNQSPTGYPMRMISSCPAIGSGIRPNCEAYGYLLDSKGKCSYLDSYFSILKANPDMPEKKIKILDKTCLCSHMRKFSCWTCGHYTYRLKDTSIQKADGSYQLLDAAHVFEDYQFSKNHEIKLPEPEETLVAS